MTAQQARNLSATANADLVGNVFPLIEKAASDGEYSMKCYTGGTAYDKRRNAALEAMGYTVLLGNDGRWVVSWG